ncbi:MAG: phloretin hydrolase [Desulfatitalea sp.]|nr:hypothetical protein [Desulfatitalea sp.]NNK01214.1 phloretin hydrolase [Desulfatitalea sp.]
MKELRKLTEEQKTLSYAKYFYRPMAPIPAEKLALLDKGPMDPAVALHIENREELQKPGHFECENGYWMMENGTGIVATHVTMPGATIAMAQWWFAWHALEDTRYKIWDPEDHFYARNLNKDRALDHSLPMMDRIAGCTHEVYEDIGLGPAKIWIEFKKPSALGYDESKLGSDKGAIIICAMCRAEGMAIIFTHFFREIEDGIELKSRYWIGYALVDHGVVNVLPEGVAVPADALKGLFVHSIKEYSNLSALLPKIYPEEKDNW